MSERNAWIFDFGSDVQAVVGEFNLIHLVHQPELFPVPATPRHCNEVLAWESRLLPVWNLPRWLGIERDAGQSPASIAGVVGYQRRHLEEPVLGVFLLSRPPQRIKASDSDVCAIPDDPPGWSDAALSCIRYGDKPVPILDLRRIFSDSLVNRRSPLAAVA